MAPDSSGGRRSRAALREMLLETGLELLNEEGLGLGAEKITYKRVFDRINETTGVTITRGSVHDRIWSSQREYQLDLLRRAAQFDFEGATDAIGERILTLMAETDGDDLGPAAFIREACRQGSATLIDYQRTRSGWDLWLSVWTMYSLNHNRHPAEAAQISDAISESSRQVDSSMAEAIGLIASQLGVTPCRETMGDRSVPDTIEIMVRFANVLAEGTTMRRRLNPALVDGFELPTGANGDLQEWTLGGLGAWLMARFCFDLDD
ncbi:MAG: hypothetical protein GY713_05520 [Actinomycetia bacterium]|nr:hypothetical protein [Actinomycetes bacterium]